LRLGASMQGWVAKPRETPVYTAPVRAPTDTADTSCYYSAHTDTAETSRDYSEYTASLPEAGRARPPRHLWPGTPLIRRATRHCSTLLWAPPRSRHRD
jgi:hypothetical protein